MRLIFKLSLLIAMAWGVQQGIQTLRVNADELRLSWGIMLANLRGIPLDAPELLDLAEPLLELRFGNPLITRQR